MSENLELKKDVVAEIKDIAGKAKSIVLVDYKGLTVAQVTELRNAFRSQNIIYKVYKNKLLKRAFEELGINFDTETLEGPTGVAFATEDVIAPAKIAFDGIVKFKKMTVKAACVEGKIYSTDEAKVLASIPSREVLVAQLLGMLTMPIRGLAIALDQIANKKA